MKKIFLRITSAFITAVSIFTLTSCGNDRQPKTGKYAWIDSNIPENQYIAAEKRLQDDFAAAANAEWLAGEVYDPIYKNSTFRSADLIINQRKRAILDDKSLDSKNLELIRAFDGLFSDVDYRNEQGMEPLKKYLAYIDDINSIGDVSNFILDNSKNPFAYNLLSISTKEFEGHKDHPTLEVGMCDLSLGNSLYYSVMNNKGIQKLEEIEKKAYYIFGKAGYSDDEIKKLLSDCFKFESELASLNPDYFMDVSEPVILDAAGFFEYSGAFPLKEIFDHYGLNDLPQYHGDYKYIEGLSGIYDDVHVEGLKAFFKVKLAIDARSLLDWDTFEYCIDSEFDKSNPYYETSFSYMDKYLFVFIQSCFLSGAMDQAYLDAYYDENIEKDIRKMCDDLVAVYKDIIAKKEWLSEENKQRIYDKLDNMVFDVMKPSNTADYGDMKLVTKEEGGSLLDAYAVINEARLKHFGEYARMDYDRTFWDIYDPEISTTQTNAFYIKWKNIVVIQAGILVGDFYSYDMGPEQKLGAIGAVLGHEISHGFDSDGVHNDMNGDRKDLIEGDDMSAFSAKARKVTQYFTGMKPFEGSDAYPIDNSLSEEAIADMGGVKSALLIASQIEDFDYDLFFRSYASVWKRLDKRGTEIQRVRTDDHPLAYLRVNVTLQQFDEFYETYGIKEGDDMYLAPDKRIAIW